MKQIKKMVIFANWKIYMKSRNEVEEYVHIIQDSIRVFDANLFETHIMTDFLSFDFMKKNLAATGIKVGVQDLFWEDSGSFAGEVSPLMLKDLGCDSAYIGHSERKDLFHETDENVNKKVLACLRNNITPLMFIGETREELESGLTEEVLRRQIRIGLSGVTDNMLSQVIIIYEPRWAIGQKESASYDTINELHVKTKQLLSEIYSKNAVEPVRVLYGGSVNLDNMAEIINIREVDGVGAARASINALNFIKLVKILEAEAKNRSVNV
jgi:triosephosphate isomerase